MRKRRLIWQLYPSYLAVVLTCIFILGWYFLSNFRSFHYERTEEELAAAANMLTKYFDAGSIAVESDDASSVCKSLSEASGYRFTIIMQSGKVVCDSDKDVTLLDNHSDRPEIKQALAGETGYERRYSQSLREDMLYVAVPLIINGDMQGVVRCSLPLDKINSAMYEMWERLLLAAILLALLTVLTTVLSTRRITRPLTEISEHAASLGRGDTNSKLPSSEITEIDVLASSMNRMANQLNDRINTVMCQRDEQNVLFACMLESVLAVDNEKKLIRMNTAAQKLFNVDTSFSRGKNVCEVVRHADLLDIIDITLNSSDIVEGNIYLPDRNLYLQAHGSILRGSDGLKIGALIVLNDVTRLHNLEVMRKDFVANVSHELKTPITSIKGFVDTLIDSPVENKADRDRFMQIINKQINRLHLIVDDLLIFSNLEHQIQKGELELQKTVIANILKNAVLLCTDKAASKNISLNVLAGDSIELNVNAQMLEQAVINLIDNAIKYSKSDTKIDVSVYVLDADIIIQVKDQGIGIPGDHIDRIFERFYCVDKSRSREMGGTGLGLAIVKHVAIAHHGRVEVESEMGAGSTFKITLPV